MIGGRNFRNSEFNRTYQALRQPGSAFKPIIYATAFDNGFTPADIILDAPVVFNEGEKEWKPVNYDRKFYGPTTLRVGLEHSRNVVTVKLLDKVGPTTVVNYAHRFGIHGNLSHDLSLALGTSVVSLMDLTSAYGIFANRGIRTEPLATIKVTDSKGKILEENYPQEEEVLPENVNYVILNVLKGVIENGTGQGAKVLGRPAGGKTGTTDRNTDVWFIGFVPSLVAGFWVGFDDNRPLGNSFTAANTAVPIWTQLMGDILTGTPPIDWPQPEGVTFALIDPESGLLATPNCPNSYLETFVKGTEPTIYCTLHQEDILLSPDYP
jgi:penicillin-binding protein 1A